MRRVCATSPSRRHTGDEPRDWISSTRPSVRSLATTLPAAPPVRFDGRSRARSPRCEAAASSRRWVSVNFTESSIRLRRRLAPPPPKPRNGQEAGGAGFRRAIRARNGDSTARLGGQSQFFLDHLVAGFRPNGSRSDPRQAQCEGRLGRHGCRARNRQSRANLVSWRRRSYRLLRLGETGSNSTQRGSNPLSHRRDSPAL
jgi:hypothetical protein